MPTRSLDPSASPLGALLPDFSVRTRDGRTIRRRDFKGRRHLVLIFAAIENAASLCAALAPALPSWRAERADLLLVRAATSGEVPAGLAAHTVEDDGPQLRERFGVGAGAALFIADRYGEIVSHTAAASSTDLPLDRVLPILELLEMRCSL